MRRIVLFFTAAAVVAVLLGVMGIPAAMAQDVKAEALPGGKANAKAGSEEVQSKAEPGKAQAKAGGTEAVAESAPKPPPPPPPPKAAPPPPPKAALPPPPPPKAAPPPPKVAPPPPPKAAPPPPPKMLPKAGGLSTGVAAVAGLGATALLIGGGLLARRIKR